MKADYGPIRLIKKTGHSMRPGIGRKQPLSVG